MFLGKFVVGGTLLPYNVCLLGLRQQPPETEQRLIKRGFTAVYLTPFCFVAFVYSLWQDGAWHEQPNSNSCICLLLLALSLALGIRKRSACYLLLLLLAGHALLTLPSDFGRSANGRHAVGRRLIVTCITIYFQALRFGEVSLPLLGLHILALVCCALGRHMLPTIDSTRALALLANTLTLCLLLINFASVCGLAAYVFLRSQPSAAEAVEDSPPNTTLTLTKSHPAPTICVWRMSGESVLEVPPFLAEILTVSQLYLKVKRETSLPRACLQLLVGESVLSEHDALCHWWQQEPVVRLDVSLIVLPLPEHPEVVPDIDDSDSLSVDSTASGMLMQPLPACWDARQQDFFGRVGGESVIRPVESSGAKAPNVVTLLVGKDELATCPKRARLSL